MDFAVRLETGGQAGREDGKAVQTGGIGKGAKSSWTGRGGGKQSVKAAECRTVGNTMRSGGRYKKEAKHSEDTGVYKVLQTDRTEQGKGG